MEAAAPIKREKLFYGSCMALITTAIAFAVTGDIAGAVKTEFILTNAAAGWFLSVFFLGFTVAQVIFSPLCDTLGMRFIVRGAVIGHVVGALLMIAAPSFSLLVAGSLICGIGAGLVEAGCNPLIAALYPNDKTVKLNIFHMWFPYGVLIGAVLAFGLTLAEVTWRMKLLLILIPSIIYAIMMWTEEYPPTEGVSAGVSMTEMLKACFVSPLMWVMMLMMFITASLELSPGRWVPAVLAAGGIHGILVLGFSNGIMGTLRLMAGKTVHKLSPTGVLLGSAIVATIGLFLLSYVESTAAAFGAAFIWACGIAYFWPTMLGFVSERNPKSGALGLGLMGAIGMLANFVVTPIMGGFADEIGHEQLPPAETVAIFEEVVRDFPGMVATAGEQADDISTAIKEAENVLAIYGADGELPPVATAEALRFIISSGAEAPVVEQAQAVINPADNYGGLISFRYLAPFGIILIIVFGVLYIQDRRAGGYKAVKLHAEEV